MIKRMLMRLLRGAVAAYAASWAAKRGLDVPAGAELPEIAVAFLAGGMLAIDKYVRDTLIPKVKGWLGK